VQATQTVFGEGSAKAAAIFVGEQPGDMEGSFRVTRHRGEVVNSDWAGPVIPTVHPSSVLRAPDRLRAEARRDFFRDIAGVADYLKQGGRTK
jgi:uracil-DNA glycosylase